MNAPAPSRPPLPASISTPKPAPAAAPKVAASVRFSPSVGGTTRTAQRVVLYGTGGIGKTTLAAGLAPSGRKPLLLDLEGGASHLAIPRIGDDALNNWEAFKACLSDKALWADYDTVIIDSMSKAEDMLAEHICRKCNCSSLAQAEGGFGKGYALSFQMMVDLLNIMDGHRSEGRTVILICHATTGKVPNPSGEDFLQVQPRLYHADKSSLREKVKEWADHVLFLSYDIEAKNGKGIGGGTRTIYLSERPSHVAKTRGTMDAAIPLEDSGAFWKQLLA